MNTTGPFTLTLTVSDTLGASASINWTIDCENPGNSSAIVIVTSAAQLASGAVITINVQAGGGISQVDAFLDGQLQGLTQTSEQTVGGVEIAANYTLTITNGALQAGDYTLSIVAWNDQGQSRTVDQPFTVPGAGGIGTIGSFNLIAFFGGTTNFLIITLTAIGTIATVLALTRRNTVQVDLGGIKLQGRKGKPLVVETTGGKK